MALPDAVWRATFAVSLIVLGSLCAAAGLLTVLSLHAALILWTFPLVVAGIACALVGNRLRRSVGWMRGGDGR